jgi:potassium/hydrogen antiporter
MALIIFAIGVMYFAAKYLSLSFSKTKIPDVLVLMGLGIIAGPLFGFLSVQQFGAVGGVISTMALVLIMFESGITMDLKSTVEALGAGVKITFTTSIITLALGALAGYYLANLPVISAITLGVIISGTSSAVVIPMAKILKLEEKTLNVLILESAITDVTAIVGTVAMMQIALSGGVGVAPGQIIGSTLASFVFATAIGLGAGGLWLWASDFITRINRTVFPAVAFVFSIYGLTEFLGFSGAIASLAFGLTLSNHRQLGLYKFVEKIDKYQTITERDHNFYEELVFILKTFFFVYLGVSMRITDIVPFIIAGLIVMGAYLFRFLLVRLLHPNLNQRDSRVLSLLVPKGLAAAVLAGQPATINMEGAALIENITYSVVFLSILFTSIAVTVGELRSAKAVTPPPPNFDQMA